MVIRKSLGTMLAIALAGLQLVAVLAVLSSSYLTSERALLDHARKLLSDVGTNTIEHSKGFLSPAEGAAVLAARLAQNRIISSDDPEKLEQLLFQQLEITSRFAGVYFGKSDGSFVYVMRDPEGPAPYRSKIISVKNGQRSIELVWRDGNFNPVERRLTPEDVYDPRTRPWFQQARESSGTIWTDPYIFFSSQQPGITMAAPVMDVDGSIRGVIGVDIEISQISDFLSMLHVGDTGKAMIINHNGDVIAHPDKSLIKTRDDDGALRFVTISEFDDPIARAAFGAAGRQHKFPVSEETDSEFTHQGGRYVSTLMPVISDKLRWTIAVYAPESDFTGEIKDNRLFNTKIALAVAFVTGLVGLYLAHAINRPVKDFAIRSQRASQDGYVPTGPPPTYYSELANVDATLTQQIAARRQTEHEYHETFDRSIRAMAKIEPASGRLLRVNDTLCEITGYSAAQLTEMRFAELVPSEYAGQPDIRVEEFAPNQEIPLVRKDGDQISVAVNAILIHDNSGQPDHLVVMIDDITEMKAKEVQIAQLSKDLSHLARGNTMGQMAAGLAHELNQPLTVIAQNADTALLSLDQMPQSGTELRQILSEIEQQALRAGDIIRALRGFIRKDGDVRTAFSLPHLVEQTLRLVQAEASEAGVQIETHLPDLPAVEGNRVQIAQVLVNLMHNSIEAIAAERTPAARLMIRATLTDATTVTVCIEDTGPGVSSQTQLFTQFETSKPSGMGLGLSICRSIISTNGGKLWYDATYSAGARFCFTLPVSKDQS